MLTFRKLQHGGPAAQPVFRSEYGVQQTGIPVLREIFISEGIVSK